MQFAKIEALQKDAKTISTTPKVYNRQTEEFE
jgi:hypothetical protein